MAITDGLKVKDDTIKKWLAIALDFLELPQKTTAQINTYVPSDGLAVYDTTIKRLKIGNGTSFLVVNTEKEKAYLDWQIEDFLQSNVGNAIVFSSFVVSGGSLSTEIPENQPNWNNTTSKARLGQSSIRITNGNNSGSAIATALNFRLFNSIEFGYFAELAIALGGQIDFANDPILQAVGFFDNFNVANLANGVGFRPPRVGETLFLKYIVRVAGVETVFDTSIPYDSGNRKYVKVGIFWDGINNSFVLIATDGTTLSTNAITNFSATYPTLITLPLAFGVFNRRNGAGAVPLARTINVDRVEKYYKSVYA
ncbi:MAG: hypothetical protein MUC49_02380 [Raineya sp.]|nr:hypothetical protein [Raineya sp.]